MLATCSFSKPSHHNSMSDFYVGRFFYVRVSVTVQKERSELRFSE